MAVTRLKQGMTPGRGKGPALHSFLAVPTQGPGLGCTGVGCMQQRGCMAELGACFVFSPMGQQD